MKQGKIEFCLECGMFGGFGRKLDFSSNRKISTMNEVL